jgi:hypothetical protein
MTPRDRPDLERENELLRGALVEQWLDAHGDHCCERWPHPDICHWPPPPVLGDPVRLSSLVLGHRKDPLSLGDDGA